MKLSETWQRRVKAFCHAHATEPKFGGYMSKRMAAILDTTPQCVKYYLAKFIEWRLAVKIAHGKYKPTKEAIRIYEGESK